MTLSEKLEEMLAPIASGLGYVLWGLEFARHGNSATLRLYIDKEGGITVDDCAKVSRQVSALMDVEDPIDVPYRLEVSSPGLERHFFALQQLNAYVEQEIRVRTHSKGIGRKRNFVGHLVEVADGALTIRDEEGQAHRFLWSDVDKTSLVVRFDD